MADFEEDDLGPATIGVRAGQRRTEQGEQSEPIFATSSFVFASAAQAAARFSGAEPGNIYSRFTNPTVQSFERRLAALEGADACFATSSGMAAVLAVCMATLRRGDHVVCAHGVFGNTALLFTQQMARFGIECSFVPLTDSEAWRAALRDETRMLFCETPANPLGQIADIAALAGIAHDAGCILVVDNTVCTAALQRPLQHGADLVVLSATKYIDGQGRCVGGAVAGNGDLIKSVGAVLRTGGMCLSPFNAWTFLKGLETLDLRMRAHSASALSLACWLREQPGVRAVHYAGMPDHPQRELALRQQTAGGGLVAFEVEGGREGAWRVIDATSLISITANLGDARTTITHPASTTHGRLSQEAREQAGIGEGLVRISVGLENEEDLRRDLRRGLTRL
jgi:O-succinylhomoserine sulfhydrylase